MKSIQEILFQQTVEDTHKTDIILPLDCFKDPEKRKIYKKMFYDKSMEVSI